MKNLFKKSLLVLIGVLITSLTTNVVATTIKRFYCQMTYSWWTNGDETGNASVGAYAWKNGNDSQKNAAWPGVKMTWLEGFPGVWYIDLDTDLYDRVIFTRLNSDGSSYWGFKTNTLTFDKNYYIITQSAQPSEVCSGEWKYYRYLDGNEPIYIKNVKPRQSGNKDARWDKPFCDNSSGNRVYAYFCNGPSPSPATYVEWTSSDVVEGTHQNENAFYAIKPTAGFYQNIILVRKNSSGWGDSFNANKLNQTGNIPLPTTNIDNQLNDFQDQYTEHTWALAKHKVHSDNSIYMYYDNSKTSWGDNIQFMIGRDGLTDGFVRSYPMDNIDGTNLYYVDLNSVSSIEWNDATYYAVMQKNNADITTSSGSSNRYSWAKDQANHYTSSYSTKYRWAYEMNSYKTYLATTDNGNDGTDFDVTYKGEGASSDYSYIDKFNHTVNVYTKTGTTYGTSNNSPATVTIKGYKMTGNGTATQQTGTVTKSSAKTVTLDDIVTTSQLDYAYSSLDGTWHFDGWAEVSSGPTSTDGTYQILDAKSAKTVYAFFSKKYTVSFNMQGYGSAISNQTICAGQKVTTPDAPSEAGYAFGGWYKESACTNAWNFASDVVTADTELFAKWTPVTLTFVGKAVGEYSYRSSDWFDPEGWEPQCVPTIEHDVIIQYRVIMYGPYSSSSEYGTHDHKTRHGYAKSIKIDKTAQLENHPNIQLIIWENSSLIVDGDIKVKKVVDEVTLDNQPTTSEDIYLRTSVLGNTGLIAKNASANTGAKYDFYTKTWKFGKWLINQYVGIPFVNMNANELYGFKIYEYDDATDNWTTPGSSTLGAWTAYNLIREYSGSTWMNFDLTGTLNLPGIVSPACRVPLTCGSRYASSETEDEDNPYFDNGGDHMFANSWVAPIHIATITADQMPSSKFVRTIYIFNAGYVDPENPQKELGDMSGQWSAFPIESAGAMENAVIPATQAFLVTSLAENATMTLDYKVNVYDPAIDADSINTFPTRAPRRESAVGAPMKLRMKVYKDSLMADQLYLFEREDFTAGFDNGWDGSKILGSSTVPQIYALNGVNKMAVDAVPDMHGALLGFKAGTDTNAYSFSFEYNDGEPLYLYDRDTQEFTEITNDATYSFTTNDTAEHQRFIISRVNSPSILTDLETIGTEPAKRAEKFLENNMLFIRRGDKVYSVDGRLVK